MVDSARGNRWLGVLQAVLEGLEGMQLQTVADMGGELVQTHCRSSRPVSFICPVL